MPASPDDSLPAVQTTATKVVISIVCAALLVLAARLIVDQILPPVPKQVAAPENASAPIAQTEESAPTITEEARQARIQWEKRVEAEANQRRAQKLQDAVAAREQAMQAERAEEARKAEAWARFYKSPRKCASTTDPRTLADCNARNQEAQQRFETLWAKGEI